MKKYLFSTLLMALFAIGFTASEEEETGVTPGAPTVKILTPTDKGVFSTDATTIDIAGQASAEAGIESVTYVSSTGITGVATGQETWEISGLKLNNGDNVIQVTVTDKNQKTATAVITITRNAYLTFLDVPFVSSDLLYAGTPAQLWVTVGIAPGSKLKDGSMTLVEVDEKGSVIAKLATLYDDGDLNAHGDEIKGDNVFSIKHTFAYDTAGKRFFRIVATTIETEGEVESSSPIFTINVFDKEAAEQLVKSLIDYKNQVETKLTELLKDNDLEAVTKAIVDWLGLQPFVSVVEVDGSILKIGYINGLSSYIFLDSNKGVVKGSGRASSPSIPLSLQTRGTWQPKSATRAASFKAPEATNIIQNKNVLIWSPFENHFAEDMEPALGKCFTGSEAGFNLRYLKNEECNIASLQNLGDYGVVILDTHGLMGNLLLTREKADNFTAISDAEVYKDYIYQYVSGAYYLVTMAYYREDLQQSVVETFFAVTPDFFKAKIQGTLPNTVIFNGSCESLKDNSFSDVFIGKGASAYLGFSSAITVYDCNKKAVEFFSSLAGSELKTTGESYVADLDFAESYEGKTWTTSYLMTGRGDMHFTLGLINGDFEYGNLSGWNVDGDGRVITQLGYLTPPQGRYMGILSTGLGYTTNYGSIWQTFKVTSEKTLSIDWNFISEEFMEYVGSKYQDYLKVTIRCGEESEVIFMTAIDAFAANYPVNSQRVSPEIVFDQGDAYQTGWHTSTFDISKYQGKTITILLESGDVGDSIYDSATLLDNITVY